MQNLRRYSNQEMSITPATHGMKLRRHFMYNMMSAKRTDITSEELCKDKHCLQ